MKVISGTQMRALDQRTVTEKGIPGEFLMERAGTLAGRALKQRALHCLKAFELDAPPRIIFLAGKGNNGGDAFVAAKFLYEQGLNVALYCVEDLSRIRGDALIHFKKMPSFLQKMAGTEIPEEIFSPGNIIVDSLLGTGFSGSLRAEYAALCRRINSSGAWIVAMDIPSGLNADSGEADPDAVCAHWTLTMAFPKKGMFSPQGILLTGSLQILDIGIDPAFAENLEGTLECTTVNEAASLLKRVPFDAHKNTRGHVFIFGGSRLYSGAVLLCAEGALRSGAGLVSCFIPEGMSVYSPVPKALMMRVLPAPEGFLQGDLPWEDLSKASSIGVGPGMGCSPSSVPFLEKLFSVEKPLILDADSLNLLSCHPILLEKLSSRKAPAVLTPHPGEMKRLLDSIAPGRMFDSRQEQALFLAEKTHAIVVLKGARSVVASPEGRVFFNTSGSPALATAGSGDVLSGILAALIADRERDPFDSVRLGVFLHGLCGETATDSGEEFPLADDLLLRIREALKFLRMQGR